MYLNILPDITEMCHSRLIAHGHSFDNLRLCSCQRSVGRSRSLGLDNKNTVVEPSSASLVDSTHFYFYISFFFQFFLFAIVKYNINYNQSRRTLNIAFHTEPLQIIYRFSQA